MTGLIGIFNADSRKSVSKFSDLRWFDLSLRNYTMERDLYKQIKLAKNIRI